MTKLEALTLTFMQIPMDEEDRAALHKLVAEAEREQAELVTALRAIEQNLRETYGIDAPDMSIFQLIPDLSRFPEVK